MAKVIISRLRLENLPEQMDDDSCIGLLRELRVEYKDCPGILIPATGFQILPPDDRCQCQDAGIRQPHGAENGESVYYNGYQFLCRQALIEGCLRRAYVWSYRYHNEDIISAAFEGVVMGVDAAIKRNKFTEWWSAYIKHWVKWRISECWHVIQGTVSTSARSGEFSRCYLIGIDMAAIKSEQWLLNIDSDAITCQLTDFESKVALGLANGYTMEEVAESVGTYKMKVSRTMKAIRQKVRVK